MSKTTKEEFKNTCSVFTETVNNYFSHLTSKPSEAGLPYLKDPSSVELKDFTGMIGISGNRRGFLYISGDEGLYQSLIKQFIGLDNASQEDILDMAGELSNVVAGNLRETYGNNFMISVPIVFGGRPDQLKFPQDVSAYVIPINWDNHEAFVVIGLE